MGIDFGGLDVGMAEKFLEHPNVHPVFQHVGGKAVPQGLAADFLVDPGLVAARIIAFCNPDSSTWWRISLPERGSTERSFAGNTHCQPISRSAFGYFLAKASGMCTAPNPAAKS